MAKLKFGLVGGGHGAFIGQVHRMAAELDGLAELVCGAFSSDPVQSRSAGVDIYHLPAARSYPSFNEMFQIEQQLPAAQRMDFVVVATPNYLHFPIAQQALQSGFHVMCDKPVTFSLHEALELQRLIQSTNLTFGLSHNYTGYAMVREARELVRRVLLVRFVGLAASICKAGWRNLQRTTSRRSGAPIQHVLGLRVVLATLAVMQRILSVMLPAWK